MTKPIFKRGGTYYGTVLRAGDLLGVSGVGFQARMIQLGTWSFDRWLNHVAMIEEHPQDHMRLRVWESTTGVDLPCDVAGRIVHGVQAHSFEKWIAYAGEKRQIVWHYPLRKPLLLEQRERLTVALANRAGRPYDYPGAIWARSMGLGWLFHRLKSSRADEDLSSEFCSELVPDVLREINVVEVRNASRWNPAYLLDFLEFIGILEPPRILLEGRPFI